MKASFIFFHLLLLLTNSVSAQNKLDSLGRKTGLWIFVQENDPVFDEFTITNCEYKFGQKNGTCLIKNRDESVLAEINYINDKKEGQAILYENEKIQELALFKADTLMLKETYLSGKIVKSEYYVTIKDTIAISSIYIFRANGKKWIWRTYEKGAIKKEIYYNRKGRIRLITEYDDQGKENTTAY
jgi:antitoxin component YwqK of YwqJK toxin-antitoxin module